MGNPWRHRACQRCRVRKSKIIPCGATSLNGAPGLVRFDVPHPDGPGQCPDGGRMRPPVIRQSTVGDVTRRTAVALNPNHAADGDQEYDASKYHSWRGRHQLDSGDAHRCPKEKIDRR